MTTRIHAARLIPGRGSPIADGVVVLDGDTIRYAGADDAAPTIPDAEIVQVDTVLPGLWDCHTHLFGARDATPGYVTADPIALRAARATQDLVAALRTGFTSVREAGGLGVHLARAVAEGSIPGPAIYAAGAALSVTGGHNDLHDLPVGWVRELSGWEPSIRVCDGVDDVVRAVREQLRAGAEVIKVCASGGVISERNDPNHQQFTRAELEAIVEVAGLADRAVMAHGHGTAAMLAAVEAGVRTIEHGTAIDDEVAAAMIERDVLLVPTRLIAVELLERASGMSRAMSEKLAAVNLHATTAIAAAHDQGVRMALGTDVLLSGIDRPAAWGNQGRELVLMSQLGMSALEVIESATANGPDTLGGRAPRSGQLVAGYDADVLAVTGDPTSDIAVLAEPGNVTHVWQGGRLVHTALTSSAGVDGSGRTGAPLVEADPPR
jgi:imidazolonepropionase-like amidohydrolase